MTMTWMELLSVQRKLLDLPRGPERFRSYLEIMRRQDVPLAAFNPMSKPHVAALLDRLLDIDAEAAGQSAMQEAAARLSSSGPDALRVGLVVADDAQGGWTNRWLFEAKQNFENKYELAHGLVPVLVWSSDEPGREQIRIATSKAIYRTLWAQRRGAADTLRERMTQEGLASRFAGATVHADDLTPQAASAIIQHLDTNHYGTIIACLYGDDAAEQCGFQPLALPVNAGLRFAASQDFLGDRNPVSELAS